MKKNKYKWGKDKCPECENLKDIRSKRCKDCAGYGKRIYKNECPICHKIKDSRSERCIDCLVKIVKPRLNTGKLGVINNAGYYEKRIDGELFLVHRLVMEEYLGRELENGEVVHHIDGDKTNNNIENLELMLKNEHHKLHSPSERMKKLSDLALSKKRSMKYH